MPGHSGSHELQRELQVASLFLSHSLFTCAITIHQLATGVLHYDALWTIKASYFKPTAMIVFTYAYTCKV
jgi:hypothetical protein